MEAAGRAPSTHPSVEEVFLDFKGRRTAIVKALTTEYKDFFQQCDPAKDDLCLYGFPNEVWQVDLPAEEVPAEIPEPVLGINFARDGMEERDWVSFVAAHSDTWLIAVAMFFGARFGFDKADRGRLFDMINDLPTVFEVAVGKVKKEGKKKPPVSNHSNSKSKSNSKRGSESQRKNSKAMESKEEEQGETACGACGENDAAGVDGFWICCDICERWFHGKCVKITRAKADFIKHYKCPTCSIKKLVNCSFKL
ncbi:PHD finger protein ALFIN-LIKE 4-like [Vigna unguiculata]|uniref:PHD finger protein ALFIN-LIKE 4-like n=1 Tax=Vigna unguiculata TaxID=3917 RepID=UPI001015CBBC|nr:PHD finger protein ALFIN-LIKE 4-like [Vigna unguiculata]